MVQFRNGHLHPLLALLLGVFMAACGGSGGGGGGGGSDVGSGGSDVGGGGTGGSGVGGSGVGGSGAGGTGGSGVGGSGGEETEPGFTVAFQEPAGTLAQGEEFVTQLIITPHGGYQGQISLSLDAPPAGISISPTTVEITELTTTPLTVMAAAGATLGSHTLTLRASEGAHSRTATWQLEVVPPSGAFLWLDTIGGSANDLTRDMVIDGEDNVYLVGQTFSAEFDGLTNSGGWDGFVIKYDSDREHEWTRLVGTPQTDHPTGVAVDRDGNVYVTGATAGVLNGEARTGTFESIFLLKMDPAGETLWTRMVGTTSASSAGGIAVDSQGHVYVVGTTRSAMNGEAHAGGNVDGFLVSFDGAGTLRWTRMLGTASADTADAVAIDDDDNVYVAGTTKGVLHGNDLVGSTNLHLSRFDASGARAWTTLFGSGGVDGVFGLAVDPNGDVVLAGQTDDSFEGQLQIGEQDAIVAKIDAGGQLLWASQFGTSAVDDVRSVAVSADSEIYVTGTTEGALSGQQHAGGADAYLRKLTSDGDEVWTQLLGTPMLERTHGVGFWREQEICLGGHSEGDLADHTNRGRADVFLACYAR